jgi:hypothetical protein
MKGKIFNAQEVQAIIAGNKTMFREVIKPQPPLGCQYTINGNQSHALCFVYCNTPRDERDYSKEPLVCVPPKPTSIDHRLECHYQVGQKIFCKETYEEWDDGLVYKSDNSPANIVSKWKPAQHMKQEHSRLTLLIKEIRVEKLADITPFDCVCEGIWDGRNVALGMSGKAVEDFKDNWNATHKKPEEKFEASPWVWCVSFEVINN